MSPRTSFDVTGQWEMWESEGGVIVMGDLRAPVEMVGHASLPVLRGTSGLSHPVRPRPRHQRSQMITGSITALWPGDSGLIASDAHGTPWRLPFRRAAVAADGFNALRVGQRVRFVQEGVPGTEQRRHAIAVIPFEEHA